MAVAADDAARGARSLKVEGGNTGSQFLEYKGALGGLATEHWGRIFFRVKVPAPWDCRTSWGRSSPVSGQT